MLHFECSIQQKDDSRSKRPEAHSLHDDFGSITASSNGAAALAKAMWFYKTLPYGQA
jgi:hypothetical protein